MKFGEKNIGKLDQSVRMALGVILMLAILFVNIASPLDFVVFIIGIYLIVEGLEGSCWFYSVLGISTKEKK